MGDGGWKSDAVKAYESRNKSGGPTPAATETPALWLGLGAVAPPILIMPIWFAVLMIATDIQKRAYYVGSPIVTASNANSSPIHLMEAIVLIALALCAVPCIRGLKRYEDARYMLCFGLGFIVSYVCTALYFFHWMSNAANPWSGTSL